MKSGHFKNDGKEFFKYVPDGAVLDKFFWDRSEVSIIQGPVGSGTSTAACFKMWAISCEQEPGRDGVRRTRWMIVRNTYDDLRDTTLKTWRYWFEEVARGAYGPVRMTNPPRHEIKTELPDGTWVDAEFIFVALDGPEDIRKLLSREVTGVWFNEIQFTEKEIFDVAHSRAIQGRYPPVLDGGPTWKGVIGDMNAPPVGHWIPYMRGDVPIPIEWDDDQRREYALPKNWGFFIQPSGLIEIFKEGKLVGYEDNKDAENMRWLDEPYTTLIKGKPKHWIDTFVMNRNGRYYEGRAVHESFVPEVHIASEDIPYRPEWDLYVGVDFARYPAAIFGQNIRGQVLRLAEFGMDNVSAETFAPHIRQFIAENFPEAMTQKGKLHMYGDPTGGSKGQGTDNTPFSIFHKNGLPIVPAPGNNKVSVRHAAIDMGLSKMTREGAPSSLFSPRCQMLNEGMRGGYHFKKMRGTNFFHPEPNKQVRFADYCDADQYMNLGMGMGTEVLTGGANIPKRGRRKSAKRFSIRNRRR